jgi:hypothetical protein
LYQASDAALITDSSQFDEDVRSIVQLKVVHGSWKREDANKVRIDVSSANLQLHIALTVSRMLVDVMRILRLLQHTCQSHSVPTTPK